MVAKQLCGGVSAIVPIARWVSLEPNAGSLQRLPVQPVAAEESASPNDRATRLPGVITVWNIFQHSYPYFDIVRVDWPAQLRSALTTAANDRTPTEYHATLNRLVARAQDGHGRVNPMVAGPSSAALPFVWDWIEGKLTVTHIGSGNAGGIQRGDVVEQINGLASEQLIAQREPVISSPTPQWKRYRAVSELLEDTADKMVSLRVRTGTAAPRDVRVSYAYPSASEPRPERIAEMNPGIFYVDISRITDADFTAALPQLQQARGIVFDLRGYPNRVSTRAILARLSDVPMRSAFFETPTFMRPDRMGASYRDGGWNLAPQQPRLTAKIAWITGGGAISYAESTMGIVEQYRLGEIIGETTAGTNGNVNSFQTPGGFQVVFTGMRVRKRDGSPHHGVGIKPTVPVSRTRAGVTAGIDELLQRALLVVGN